MLGGANILRLRALAAAAMLFAGITLGVVLGRLSTWLVPVTTPYDGAPPQGTHDARGANERASSAAHTGTESRPQVPLRPTSPAPTPVAPEPPAATAPVAVAAPPAATAPRVARSPSPAGAPTPATPPGAAPAAQQMPAGNTPTAASQEPAKPAVTPSWQPAGAERSGDADQDNAPEQPGAKVKLINPDRGEARAAAARPADDDVADRETDQQGLAACAKRYSSFRRSDGTYQPFGRGRRQRCPLLR